MMSAASKLSPRARVALALEHASSATSRRLGRGSGEMIGGKVALRTHPGLLGEIAAGRALACVSGTNGKTTTTRLLAAALSTAGPVASNSGGANMGPGVLHALARRPYGAPGALEVDEIWLPSVAREVRPRAIVLLNVTRDQLDRSNETRRISSMWRSLGGELPGCTAVANCDDPLVTYAAEGFDSQVWVAAGQNWTADAMVCPSCGKLLERGPEFGWRCGHCELRRPTPDIEVLSPDTLRWRGAPVTVSLSLPGRVNTGNAAHAAAAAELLGVAPAAALAAMSSVEAVQGRYSEAQLAPGRRGRLLLAKNPAGWVEMLELLDTEPERPVIVDFNSRTADGRDPSWLWDVPFERLRGRLVLVTGERREDVGVRLAYAQVPHTLYGSAEAAAAAAPEGVLDVVANYTAFRDLLVRTSGRGAGMSESAMRIALVYPELLGTYGDGGNALVLATRLQWRGLESEVVSVPAGAPLPEQCDLYLLGGGEDEPQVLAVDGLRAGHALSRAVDSGATVLAVCAGYQIVGQSFPGSDGRQYDGVGLLPVETRRSFGAPGEPVPPRAVGDIVIDPDPVLGLPALIGYENHGGRTRPLPGAKGRPVGIVRRGIGNGTPDRAEGWVMGKVLATYLHGPVLAQNPALADLLLRWVNPDLPELEGPAEAEELRRVRLKALGASAAKRQG